ncbi:MULTISPECIES: hypothetical protein [Metabacillus]|uniref:Uncharacterized protein n=1 Tax=Metabacillus hrfriensis TaxID=3048891 RepID=A0ACD4RD10_9BACI|nr:MULTISPECIES: hypothetical protein [Metabacillus]UAL52775.1 hypothetical protein K8L98_02740 [Metabacillus dongyingensis]UOK58415.1 hypothetical protein MGI18_03745 [Bacillus sp. OVS6]WHZ58314.1 hypothetical protein QLQ22_02765 [Metabacillus sp. CT-WN-B3]
MKPETALRRLGETELIFSALGLGTWQSAKAAKCLPCSLKTYAAAY